MQLTAVEQIHARPILDLLDHGTEIPVVPLRLGSNDPSQKDDPWGKPLLMVTVHLYPASVRQKWSTCQPAVEKLHASTISAISALAGRARAFKGVEYHLPSETLDDYAHLDGLSLASSEFCERTYCCPILVRLTHLFLTTIDSPTAASPFFLDHFVMLFCAQLAHVQLSPGGGHLNKGGLTTRQKRLIRAMLDQDRCQNVKLSELAGECGLSISHFARSFKISFGMPVHQWIITQRVERSKELLLNRDMPLVEVAFLAGFCDQASFNRAFAKTTGQTPGRWRRERGEADPARQPANRQIGAPL